MYNNEWFCACAVILWPHACIIDFDEKCAKEDDWDVDMSAYYDYGEWMIDIRLVALLI